MARRLSLNALTTLFIVAGALHFILTPYYMHMMPSFLSWHRSLVLVSGACEIAGGAGLLIPATRRLAALGLIALLIAVFPANVTMALGAERFVAAGHAWVLWLRLPLQFVLIAWIWWAAAGKPQHKCPYFGENA
ncbi:MAG: hypothetical protein M3Z14_01805 [Candidatus Eremiobacteraeota bacterium]|nr:hypothetical protein [Candidatus Eremiobacteraeota bacterium]